MGDFGFNHVLVKVNKTVLLLTSSNWVLNDLPDMLDFSLNMSWLQ